MPILTRAAATDRLVAAARDVPSLMAGLRDIDPALHGQLAGKSLIASRSPWGTLAGGIVGWASARYGLGWDAELCALVGGAGVLIGSYAMRWITRAPISGLTSSALAAECRPGEACR